MKKIYSVFLILFIGILANAEIMEIPFIPEEFDVDIYQYPHMILIENPQSEQLDTVYTFSNEESSYEIRYTFFKQTISNYPNIKIAFVMCILPIFWNIAGYELDNISNFNDSDVKNEFNGDFGSTGFIVDPNSDFGKGYKFIMADFFYKENQGIVVRTILFNDLNFVQLNEKFLEIYHSFSFHE